MEKTLTVKEASVIAGGVTEDCISQHCRRQTFSAYKDEGSWRILQSSLVDAINHGKIGKPLKIPSFKDKDPIICESCGKPIGSPQAYSRHLPACKKSGGEHKIQRKQKAKPSEPDVKIQKKAVAEEGRKSYDPMHETVEEKYSTEDLFNAIFLDISRYEKDPAVVLRRLDGIERKAKMFKVDRETT